MGHPMNSLLGMNVVETWFVAVWGLCWCNIFIFTFMFTYGLLYIYIYRGHTQSRAGARRFRVPVRNCNMFNRLTCPYKFATSAVFDFNMQGPPHIEGAQTAAGVQLFVVLETACRKLRQSVRSAASNSSNLSALSRFSGGMSRAGRRFQKLGLKTMKVQHFGLEHGELFENHVFCMVSQHFVCRICFQGTTLRPTGPFCPKSLAPEEEIRCSCLADC